MTTNTSSKIAPAAETPEQDHRVVPTAKENWQRLMSVGSISVDGQQDAEKIIVERMSGFLQLAKMLSVVAIPVVALIVVCSLQLSAAIQGYNAADVATGAFQEFLHLDRLITGLQLERGTSAAWVSSRGTNVDVKIKLTSYWAQNDEALRSLTRWSPGGLRVADRTFQSARELSYYITGLRSVVIGIHTGFTEAITDYTAIISTLIASSMSVIVMSNMSTIWSPIVSNSALLLASDVIGIQRALLQSLGKSVGEKCLLQRDRTRISIAPFYPWTEVSLRAVENTSFQRAFLLSLGMSKGQKCLLTARQDTRFVCLWACQLDRSVY